VRDSKALADPAVSCHLGKCEATKALMHDPKDRLAVCHHQLDVRAFFRRVVRISAIKLFAAYARLNNVAVGRKRVVSEILRSN